MTSMAGRAYCILALVVIGACTTPEVAPPPPPPQPEVAAAPPPVVEPPPALPPSPPPILPFEEAVLSAANQLLGAAKSAPVGGGERRPLIVDPLVNGLTGAQSQSTQAMGTRIVRLVRDTYPQYEVLPFNAASVARAPLVLIGTFTGVNGDRKTEGRREAYRICLALADLKSGTVVGKGLAFAAADGVDPMPLPLYRDAPALAEDAATQGYIRSCQGTKAGDPVHPAYLDRILVAATLAEAADAYGRGEYAAALRLYETAERMPGGEQLRTYTGQYLSYWRLGRSDAAGRAFARIVDHGMYNKRLGVKFLFRPGTATLWSDLSVGPALPYSTWVSAIASSASRRESCLVIVGHASPTGSEAVNERLSLQRAQSIERLVLQRSPALAKRVAATGVGSREAIVGNGRDDASDALDRRVEFKVVDC
jgi:hypothetical protein